MKPKDIVYHFEITIDFKENKVKQEECKFTVLGVNSHNLVINDTNFTTIKHTGWYRGDNKDLFNQVKTYDTSGWGLSYSDYIRSYLYTSTSNSKIAYRRLKKALEKFIYQKHGRYCNAISFLDQIKI